MIDLSAIPNDPGCYLFKDSSGRIIYIGKAKNLRKRVASYFQKNDLDPKTESLVEKIESVDFIATDSEVEALILENNLIKKHQPKYNIDLKDSKNYAYLLITDEEYPRLLIARKKTGQGRFFGPFVSAQDRDYVRYVLNKTFGFRRCKKMPKKPCLRYHINLCSTPCTGMISREDYNDRIEKAKLILKGKTKKLIHSMNAEMTLASDILNFERAKELRNQIEAISNLSKRQLVDRQRKHDEDILNFITYQSKVHLLLFNIYKGTLINKEEYSFEQTPDFFEEFLIQYYSERNVPKELIIPQMIDESVLEFLETLRGGKLKVAVPKRGAKKDLLQLVKKNIELTFFGDLSKIEELQEVLGLDTLPIVIECFDISHLSGTSTVGSMVQYRNARPDKNNYRRFKIRTVDGIADTAAISEIVRRRYYRLKKEGAMLPNLIIIDGGASQLNSAIKALDKLELQIPVIAIAKKFEDIYMPGHVLPIRLEKKDRALQFIREIRDEAHRFAIKYNRLLRKKEMIK
jgi:excinuclease ABC subunit C